MKYRASKHVKHSSPLLLQGNPDHDNWIFALATLLSSTLVYNAIGVINDDALGKLKYLFVASNILFIIFDMLS